jgi:hypothetical protein
MTVLTRSPDLGPFELIGREKRSKRTCYNTREYHLRDGVRACLHQRSDGHDDDTYKKSLLPAKAVAYVPLESSWLASS